jgi:hypothetical protein
MVSVCESVTTGRNSDNKKYFKWLFNPIEPLINN